MEHLYSGHPWGTNVDRYIGVAFIEGLFCTHCSFGTWVPGRYTEVTFIQGWPLRGVPLYSETTIIIYTVYIHFKCIIQIIYCIAGIFLGYKLSRKDL